MKKYFTYLLLIALCVFPMFTQAMSSYENAVNAANKYIEQFKNYDYDRYINIDNTKQIYMGGKLVEVPPFYRGGFLSKEEYEISKVRGHSYLSTGIEYWLSSDKNSDNAFVLSNVFSTRIKKESSGVRVTVIPKESAYVKGTGHFNDPWEFLKSYMLYVGSNDTNMGTVSPNEIQYVIDDGKGIVKYFPKTGYKYAGNTCENFVDSIIKNVSLNQLEISGLRQDTSCKINFEPKIYTLSLEETGITTNPVPKTIYLKYNTGFYSDNNASIAINKIEIPKKIGYIFKGYKLGETKLINDIGVIDTTKKKNIVNDTENQQLVSSWEAIKYNVIFNKNASDAKGEMELQQFTYDQSNNLRLNNYTRTGYTFLGWSADPNAATATYNDGASVSNLSATNNETVSLYAIWQANSYNIKFESCDGTIASDVTLNKKYNEYFDITAVYTKIGYSITGYSKTSCNGIKDYSINSQTSNLSSTDGATITLYTLWKSNNYEISYKPNGGNGTIVETQCTYDTSCKITDKKFNREGYEFVGWGTSSTATSKKYKAGDAVTNLTSTKNGTVSLYAVWKKCVAGKYSNTNVCENCSDGKWSVDGSSVCSLDCEAGYKCSGGSKNECEAGSYSTDGASSCTVCPAGKYNTGTGNTSCSNCSAGTYASGTGNTSCTSCSSGTYSTGGASSCSTCSAGTYNTGTGNTSCSTCPANYYCTGGSNKTICPTGTISYSGSKSSSDCKSCPDGTYYNGSSCVTCPAGYKCVNGNKTACAEGTYSSDGSSSCTACAAGKYNTGTGNTSCTSCPAGKYASGTGNTSCTSCEAGKYASGTGNTSCTSCSAGTYSSGTGNSSCTSCSSNTYASGTGNTSCTSCPSGTSSSSGASSCTTCNPGTYMSNGKCVPCTAGYYCENGTRTLCEAGTYSNEGASSCTTCSAGTYNTGTGNKSCSTCPANYYCTGGTNKTTCPNGGTSSSGSSSSSQCTSICDKSDSVLFGTSKGSISGNSTGSGINALDSWGIWCHTGDTLCLGPKAYTRVCASDECGSFKNLTAIKINEAAHCDFGLYWCTECCSNGTNNGDGTCKRYCKAGTYDNGTTCVDCPVGKYSSAGAKSCTSCSAGMWTSSTGASTCDIECPSGYKCLDGVKTICPAGTESYGGDTCRNCHEGYYSSSAGTSSCTRCGAGKYQSSRGATSCDLCPAGKIPDSSHAGCNTCAAGTYNTGTGNSSCTTCPAGYYCTGGTNKTACSTGYTSNEGSTSSSDCKDNIKPTVSCEKRSTGTGGVSVYCTCSDSGSGCESATVTKTLTSSDYVYMSDRAGNQGSAYVTVSMSTEYRYKTCTNYAICETSACGYKSCAIADCGVKDYTYSDFGAYKTSKYGSYTAGCKSRTGTNEECSIKNYTYTMGTWKTAKYGDYQSACEDDGGTCSEYNADGSKCDYSYGSWGSWSSWSDDTCTDTKTKKCESQTVNTTCKTYKASGSICDWTYSDYGYYTVLTKIGKYNCGNKITSGTYINKYRCAKTRTAKRCADAGCETYNTKEQTRYKTRTATAKSCAAAGCKTLTYKYKCPNSRTTNYNSCTGYSCPSTATVKSYNTCENQKCGPDSCRNEACGCAALLGWSSWSDWSTTSCTETSIKQCDSRTVYK